MDEPHNQGAEQDSGEIIDRKVAVADRLLSHYCTKSLRYYLQHVVIACEPKPRPFGAVAEPWQRELLKYKIPAIEYVAGLNPSYYDIPTNTGGPLTFLTVLPRGHDKSSLEGRLASWLLIASKKYIPAYIVATDKDQGKLILAAMRAEAELNPWLYDQLTFTDKRVDGPCGFVEVLPADAGSAYGLRGRFYIFDEWTHWKNELMSNAVMSGSEKVPGRVLVILSNAGVKGSWQHTQKLLFERDSDCKVFERQGQLASWMNADRVRKMGEKLPPAERRRVLHNEWIDAATESGYLLPHEIDACASLGHMMGLQYRIRRDPGVSNYVAAIDYGASKDRTVCVVLHQTKDGSFVVDRMDVFQGSTTSRVPIAKVEEWVMDVHKGFAPRAYVVDPSQMEGTIQLMTAKSMNVIRFTGRSGADNMAMAILLQSLIVKQRLLWYNKCGYQKVTNKAKREEEQDLTWELKQLVVKRMSYGWRFDHESGHHDDKAVAVGMAALTAVEYTA